MAFGQPRGSQKYAAVKPESLTIGREVLKTVELPSHDEGTVPNQKN